MSFAGSVTRWVSALKNGKRKLPHLPTDAGRFERVYVQDRSRHHKLADTKRDQNQNGTLGENPGDTFTRSFTIATDELVVQSTGPRPANANFGLTLNEREGPVQLLFRSTE